MTTIERPAALWNTMPGWGIAANLTPPELIASRRIKVVRKLFAAVLVVLLVVGVGVYTLAMFAHRSATSALATEQSRTSELNSQQRAFQGAVQVQGSITTVQTQLAGLLANDVSVPRLVGKIIAKLPADMTVNLVSVSLDGGSTASAGAGGSALDASGATHIGTVSLSGNGKKLSDVSAYIDALATVSGVVTPYPANSTFTGKTVQWSISLTLTGALLTHRYDVGTNGAK